jgi:acetyl-CoA carboxylase carboxyl transferase beta subunit/acetyl-CoA carboxylase carboxyl transferase alpha subunit
MKTIKLTPKDIFKGKTRNPNRIRSSDLIKLTFTNITYFKTKDQALICGRGLLNKNDVIFMGQEKPKGDDLAYAHRINFGMMKPEGYRQAIEILGYAADNCIPVITFIDTPGADPSTESASTLQSWAISDCISTFCTVRTPTISLILGEGGSGGALGLQVTDRRLMMEHAMYYVIAPESCGSIIFRDNTKIDESIELLRPTSRDMLEFGIVDEIIKEPETITDHDKYAKAIKPYLTKALADIARADMDKLIDRRRKRVLSYGVNKKQGLISQVVDFFQRSGDTVASASKAKVIDADNVGDILELAYLQSKNIDLSKPHILCEKAEGRGCGQYIPQEVYLQNFKSCPHCGRGETLTSDEWIELLCDTNSFYEFNSKITVRELMNREDLKDNYLKLLDNTEIRSGMTEALTTGVAKIGGYRCVLAITNFNFIGGSMGAALGEKFYRAVSFCIVKKLPLISICASGGARMHEGTISLMQMAKTNMALSMLKEAQLPYISILVHPCTGGALASYATQGTINIGEENALIAFAGPRVTALAGIKVEPSVTISNYVYEREGLNELASRKKMRKPLARYLKFYYETHSVEDK